jgi:hypothetical protein
MDWLASHKVKLNFYENIPEFEYGEGNARILQGIQNPISVRKISAFKIKRFSIKGCPLYSIQVLISTKIKEPKAEDHRLL